MKITGRQIVASLGVLAWVVVGIECWWAILGSTAFLDSKDLPTWQGCVVVPSAILHGIGTAIFAAILLCILYDKNPTFEFPRPSIPKAVARKK